MSWNTFLTAITSAAAFAAVVTGLWALINNRVLLYATYTLEQKKEVKKSIGEYHGRMLEAAADWDRRMQQLYDNEGKHMNPGEKHRYDRDQYLFLSVVFRFLSLVGIARKFEATAFYIDSRIAKGKELDFLRYAKGFLWVMTFSDLTPHDGMPARDHFLNDEFRPLLDMCYRRVEKVLPEDDPKAGEIVFDWRRFRAIINQSRPGPEATADSDNSETKAKEDLDPDGESLDRDSVDAIRQVLAFFDGIKPAEHERSEKKPQLEYKRRRWDRIVCLHLLVICFIGTFGYSWQKKKDEICSKRTEAIKRLVEEARDPGLYIDGESRPQDRDWEPVLNTFRQNLKMIGMEINKYDKYMIHLPRMEGRKQIRELERDLQNAIKLLAAESNTSASTAGVSYQGNGDLEQHEPSSETSLTA